MGRHQPYRIPELSAGLQRTLAALCSYVDHHHPEKTICATKERLARDQLLHRSTLYRHLHQLEALGLITREAQARQSQRFVRSRLQLTPEAIALLGFLTPRFASSTLPSHPTPLPIAAGLLHQQPKRRQPLPEKLQWLHHTGGLSKPAIFKLMGLATQHQKRLEDITTTTYHILYRLSGHALFAYLRTLIQGPKDFTQAAQRQHDKEHAQAQQNRQDAVLQTFLHRYAGASLTNPDHSTVYRLDARLNYVWVMKNGKHSAAHINSAWVDFLQNGLDNGSLLVSQPTDLTGASEKETRGDALSHPLYPAQEGPSSHNQNMTSPCRKMRHDLSNILIKQCKQTMENPESREGGHEKTHERNPQPAQLATQTTAMRYPSIRHRSSGHSESWRPRQTQLQQLYPDGIKRLLTNGTRQCTN